MTQKIHIIKPKSWGRRFTRAMAGVGNDDIIVLPRPAALLSAQRAIANGWFDRRIKLACPKQNGKCHHCASPVFGFYCVNTACVFSHHAQQCAAARFDAGDEYFDELSTISCDCEKHVQPEELKLADFCQNGV